MTRGQFNHNRKSLVYVCLSIALLLAFCFLRNEGPTAEKAKAFLTRHREDIEVVVDYLKELECDSASVDKGREKAFYKFEWHDILSEKMNTSLQRLWAAGCRTIYKDDNTISFEIWGRTRGDVDCGIACTIDGRGMPKTQFQIRCEELEDGWFYYYDDYEEYRKDPSKYEEN